MTSNFVQDLKKKPIELNLSAARKRQRKQTGLVHFCYESHAENDHDTIPIFENACFSLALFRSRLIENICEGKVILEKLLAFESEGNFPVYLHEFPHCRDRMQAFNLLPVFFWIAQEFDGVLGGELKLKLEQTFKKIDVYGDVCQKEHHFSKSAESKWLAFRGDLKCLDWMPKSAVEWGHYWIALQMVSAKLKTTTGDIEDYIGKSIQNWNPEVHAFCGSYKRQFQERDQPALTLYDLYMSCYYQSFSKRSLLDHPIHLQAALIFSDFGIVPEKCKAADYFAVVQENEEIPFILVWGDDEHTHTLVGPSKKNIVSIRSAKDSWEISYVLPEEPPQDVQEQAEISFFCNTHPDNRILINQQKATAFGSEDQVVICSATKKITISFHPEKNAGDFFGHLSLGNRPLQKIASGADLYSAYDWQISLRTLRRSKGCCIKAYINISTI